MTLFIRVSDINDIIDAGTPDFHSMMFLKDFNSRNILFWDQDRTTTEGRAL